MTRITRVEIITDTGRDYVCWEDDNDITVSYQDDGKTLKVFVNKVEPKSPVEEAYKRWMGEYPPTTPSVDSTDDIRWRAYQMGYNASKVSETPQEPEELKTLYQMWNDGECRDDICYLVKSWMSQYEIDRWCDDWDVGFSDCLDKLNKGLK